MRFICPALLVPKEYGVIDEGNEKCYFLLIFVETKINKDMQRVLVLASKILQNLANIQHFKEDFMVDFNTFIDGNTSALLQLFQTITVTYLE